jgi:hemolysin activation/secretion protein
LLCGGVGSAFGQTLPGPVAPGRIEQQFQPQPQPRATGPSVVPEIPEGVTAPAGAENVHFTLRAVQIEDVTVYPGDTFTSLYTDWLGKDVTLAQIFTLATEITARYRNDGYILSQATVPAQKIADGTVRLRVVEGFIDRVIVDGDDYGKSKGLIDAYGQKITQSRPLRASDLERYLLLMNDLPGVTARSFLRPSPTTPGAADLSIVLEEKQFGGYAGFDNRGSRFVGPYQGQVGGNANNLLGLYDRTDLRFIATSRLRELQYTELDHSEQLDAEGTQLRLTTYRSHGKPGGAVSDLDIDALVYDGTATISHPFIRSRARNFSVHSTFDVINADFEQSGVPLISDRLRVLRLGASYDFVDTLARPAVNFVDIEFSHGLDLFDASPAGSPLLSRPQATPDFAKVTVDASRQQPLTDKLGLLLAMTGQYAANSLLSPEQFGFGGAQFGRGYDPSQLLGDDGIAGKIELQYGETLGRSWLQDYQFYAFYDAGRVVYRGGGPPGQSPRRSGTSTGLGLRSNVTDWASGFVEFARQLTSSAANPNESGDGSRIFFGVMTRF